MSRRLKKVWATSMPLCKSRRASGPTSSSSLVPKLAKDHAMAPGDTTTGGQLHRMLGDGEELAILDVRPGGIYAEEHLFYAASMPLSRLDFDVSWRIPKHDT